MIDASPQDLTTVKRILAKHLPECEVRAFGSRVSWTAKPYSDLDLVVLGPKKLSRKVLTLIKSAFEESAIPITVDVLDWHRISPEFRENIEKEYETIQTPDERNAIPEGWRFRKVSEIAEVVGGGTPKTKKPEYWGGDIPWLTPKDLSGEHFRYVSRGERNITKAGIENSSARLVPPGTVLLTSRAPVGYVAMAKNPIATNQGFRSLVVNEEHDPDFIYYLFLHNTDYLKQHASGSTFQELSGSTLKSLEFLIPPLSEQRAIAHILRSLDDKIELNRRMNETLEAMARAIFKSWFVDFLPVRAKMAAANKTPYVSTLPAAEKGKWFVYAIECYDGSIYIGQTEDLRQRWQQHSSGKGGRWTKGHPPVRVVHWELLPSQQEAIEREKWLKTGYGRKWLKQTIAAASARTQTGDPVRAKAEGSDPLSACGHAQAGGLSDEIAALFPDSFQDSDLGEIPKGWEVNEIKECCKKVQNGGTPKRSEPDYWNPGTIPWLTSGEVRQTLITTTENMISELGLKKSSAKWLPEDSTVVALYGATAGQVALVSSKMTTNQAVCGLIPKASFRYFNYLSLDRSVGILANLARGSAQQNISKGIVETTKVIIPRTDILISFDQVVLPVFDKWVANLEESKTLASLRDALLPKLISGELHVPDTGKLLESVI